MERRAEMIGAELGTRARGEQGVILILVMLVVLVLACVMVQLFFTTSVNKEITLHQKIKYPMKMAAQGAFLQAKAVLLQDMENQSAGEEETGGGVPGEGTGEEEGMGQGGEEGDPEGGGSGDEGTGDARATADSLVDEWARPGAITVVTGWWLKK